ncbi:MAG: SDR family oxidoreductase [Candidatus Omnitrophica bacterium]|nr:SDR family oxidoreductase [Candidatus Omnitrophota bacterium]
MFEGLRRKRVLITGASGGLGACMARLLASYGAAVGLHYKRNARQAAALRAELTRQGGEAETFQGDLLEARSCRALMGDFLKRFGAIDVLINNAGAVFGPAGLEELRAASWDRTFALNARAPFLLAQQAFARMKRQGGGKIINISSVAVKYGGSPTTLHYAAAKAALEAVTVGMATAGAPHHILVNAIRAGFIETSFHRAMGRTDTRSRVARIPLKRAGRPLDVARLVLFLASEAGDFITGSIVTVSGGD